MWVCKKCGIQNYENAQFCSNCGTRLNDTDRFCKMCGTAVPVKVTHEEVQRAAEAVQPFMATIMEEMVKTV